MPALHAFGRRWRIASDDFVFPLLLEMFVRILWLGLIIGFSTDYHSCNTFIKIASSGLIVISCAMGILCGVAAFCSSRGHILNTEVRWPVVYLIYLKVFLFFPELGFTSSGVYWSFYHYEGCNMNFIFAMRFVTTTCLIMFASILITFTLIVDPLGTSDSKNHSLAIWERRCRILFCDMCCLGRNRSNSKVDQRREAFAEIAEFLVDYFRDVNVHLVPSDVVAGLMLLQRWQHKHGLSPAMSVSSIQVNTELPSNQWLSLDSLRYYMHFAAACYGWPFYIFANPCNGWIHLCRAKSFGSCCSCPCSNSYGMLVEGENLDKCGCHLATIECETGLWGSDNLLYVSSHNALFEPSFYISVAPGPTSSSTNSGACIVVAVRGTMSLHDALTDMTASPTSLKDEGKPHFLCHNGILRSACYVRGRLINDGLLKKAFEARTECCDRLVLCGHSLGAGVVSILALLLQPLYPQLRCYAYSPPFGLMNAEAAEFCRDFVVSVALGYDLIPRLSIPTLNLLKRSLLIRLRQNQEAKCSIFAKNMFSACLSKPSLNDQDVESDRLSLMDNENYMSAPPTSYNSLSDVNSDNPSNVVDMSFAGHMFYVIEAENAHKIGCCSKPKIQYTSCWTSADAFSQLLIDGRMVSDHLPDSVQAALDQLALANQNSFVLS